MIRVFAVVERVSGIGEMIFRDERFPKMEPGLLWGFLSALNSLSKEIVGLDEKLGELDMQNMKILVYSLVEEYGEFDRDTDPAFVAIADKYDNEDFLLQKLRKIRELLGPYLVYLMTPLGKISDIPIPPAVMEQVIRVIKYTQTFPEDLIKNLHLQRLLRQTHDFVKFTHIFLSDVDEGILFVAESKREVYYEPLPDLFQLTQSKDKRNRLDPNALHSLQISEVFLTLLSEIPFNRDLFLDTLVKTKEGTLSREGFAIKQISPNSDFYLMTRFIYDHQHREEVEGIIKSEADRIFEALSAANVPKSTPV